MNPDERKLQILQCAKKLFSKNGYYETQISDIVDEAGIARGTIYQYFKNKDEIFATLFENFYKKWERMISEAEGSIDPKTITPENYLKSRIKSSLYFFASDNEMCNIVLRMGVGINKNFDSVQKKLEKKIFNVITNDLKIGQQFNNISKDIDTQLLANIFTGALFRIAYYYFVAHKTQKESHDIDLLADKIVSFYSPGLFIKKQPLK